jgi:serpin B
MSASNVRWPLAVALFAAGVAVAQNPSETAMNTLACSMYGKLAANEENVFFSPFSVSTALAMAAEGARGETAREMAGLFGAGVAMPRDAASFHYDWTPLHAGLGRMADRLAPKPAPPQLMRQLESLRSELAAANAKLESDTAYDDAHYRLGEKAQALADQINLLQRQIDPTEFRAANAVWVERSFALEGPYLEAIAGHYKTGGAKPVDFAGDPEAARRTINDWVAARTAQRIQDLLAPETVDESTRLVLTNAVHFLGEWLEPFDSARTMIGKFALRDGGQVDAALMRARKNDGVKYAAFHADGSPFATPAMIALGNADASGRYPENGFQLVELPYRGGALSMQILLPASVDDLSKLEALLLPQNLERWNAALETRSVDVTLPKFRLETGYELSQVLQHLGMQRAFVNPVDVEGGAQFDGISAAADPSRRLYIGAVVHRAFVQVDEKGTEAAAATAVEQVAGAAMPTMVPFTPVFRADRPFVFLIRENSSGAVLFLGRLARPVSQ